MALGMELMLKNLLRNMGVDAESIMEVAEAVQTYLREATAREREILARTQRMEDALRLLCTDSGVKYPALEGEVENGPGK